MPKAPSARPLAVLAPFIGSWSIEADVPGRPGQLARGRTTFEWLGGRTFVVQRWTMKAPFPSGISVLGRDGRGYAMHYFDSRGVARVYKMTLRRGRWELVRHDPDFSQRFRGTFSDRGRTITGAWEISDDGRKWQHDFDVTYRKSRER